MYVQRFWQASTLGDLVRRLRGVPNTRWIWRSSATEWCVAPAPSCTCKSLVLLENRLDGNLREPQRLAPALTKCSILFDHEATLLHQRGWNRTLDMDRLKNHQYRMPNVIDSSADFAGVLFSLVGPRGGYFSPILVQLIISKVYRRRFYSRRCMGIEGPGWVWAAQLGLGGLGPVFGSAVLWGLQAQTFSNKCTHRYVWTRFFQWVRRTYHCNLWLRSGKLVWLGWMMRGYCTKEQIADWRFSGSVTSLGILSLPYMGIVRNIHMHNTYRPDTHTLRLFTIITHNIECIDAN